MFVNAAELNELKVLVYVQRNIKLLGEFPEQEDILAHLGAAKKTWWDNVRSKYRIPESVKLSVELDGDVAGEIRVKGTGQAWVPDNQGRSFTLEDLLDEASDCDTPPAPATGNGALVSALNEVFRQLGLDVEARAM